MPEDQRLSFGASQAGQKCLALLRRRVAQPLGMGRVRQRIGTIEPERLSIYAHYHSLKAFRAISRVAEEDGKWLRSKTEALLRVTGVKR